MALLPHQNTNSNHCRRLFFFLNLAAVLSILSILPGGAHARPQGEVGYGPLFDACGDNCQTQLLHFCTQGRDAQQQAQCWCGEDAAVDNQFSEKMELCLASCDPQVTDTAVQRNQIMRYKQVVCKGSTAEDADFDRYYSTKFSGNFVPQATDAAPPPAMAPTTFGQITVTRTTSAAATANPTSKSTPSTTEVVMSTPTSASTSTEEENEVTSTPTSVLSTPSSSDETPTQTGVPESTPTSTETSAAAATKDDFTPGQIAGISLGAVSGFALLLLCAALLVRIRSRRRSDSPSGLGKRVSSMRSSRDQFSPISPMAQQIRDTPDGFSPDISTAQRLKRALAAFVAWRPEPGRFDIEDQVPYGNRAKSNNNSPEPPIIRVTSRHARKESISPPMMMTGASLGTGIAPHAIPYYQHQQQQLLQQQQQTVRQVTPSPPPAVIAPRSTSPARRDVILPAIPAAPVDETQIPHAVTTPTGYSFMDPTVCALRGQSRRRPDSEATEMDLDTSDCSSDYSRSDWTDYEESTFNHSASQRALDQLVQEVDRRNQSLRKGSR